MTGRLLLRGMLAGGISGILVFLFARFFGEPLVDHAIAFEDAAAKAAGAIGEPELVSRATQAGWGLLTGILIFSVALGGLFSLVFTFVHGRCNSLNARANAVLIAIFGFVAVTLVPAIKYPANPPATGNPDTIAIRTELHFLMIFVSIAALIIAIFIGRRLKGRFGAWNAAIAAGLAYAGFVVVVEHLLPPINEVPEGFPATTLWQFRLASIGMHALLWSSLGIIFGILAEKCFEPETMREHTTAFR